MTTARAAAPGPEYRPAFRLADALDGDAGLVHMGRHLGSGVDRAACGAPVRIWTGGPFNPDYRVCERCLEAAGFDPRVGQSVPVGAGRQGVMAL